MQQPFAQGFFIEDHFMEIILVALSAANQTCEFVDFAGLPVAPRNSFKVRNSQPQNPALLQHAKPFTQHLVNLMPAKMLQHMRSVDQFHGTILRKRERVHGHAMVHVRMVLNVHVDKSRNMLLSATQMKFHWLTVAASWKCS